MNSEMNSQKGVQTIFIGNQDPDAEIWNSKTTVKFTSKCGKSSALLNMGFRSSGINLMAGTVGESGSNARKRGLENDPSIYL